MRVFVVDDDVVARRLLRDLVKAFAVLQWAGEAESGEEAVATVAASRPHVVVMDYSLPGMDGVAATERLRAAQPEVDILAWTSSSDDTVRDAFLTAGASAVFTKAEAIALIRDLARRAAT